MILGSLLLGLMGRVHLHLLLLYHHVKPLLEIFLHFLTASLQERLDSFDFTLQVFQLVVLSLVRIFMLSDLTLYLLFLRRFYDFSIFINKASHCILFSDLLNLAGKIFNLSSRLVNALS